jgi:chromosome segregation ATPase
MILTDLIKRLDKSKEELEDYRKSKDDLLKESSKLESDLIRHKDIVDTYASFLIDKNQKIKQLQDENTSFSNEKEDIRETMARLRDDTEKIFKKLGLELKDKDVEIKCFKEQIKRHQEQSEEQQKQIEAQQKQIEAQQKQIEAQQEQIQGLEKGLEQKDSQFKKLEEEFADFKERLSALETS